MLEYLSNLSIALISVTGVIIGALVVYGFDRVKKKKDVEYEFKKKWAMSLDEDVVNFLNSTEEFLTEVTFFS